MPAQADPISGPYGGPDVTFEPREWVFVAEPIRYEEMTASVKADRERRVRAMFDAFVTFGHYAWEDAEVMWRASIDGRRHEGALVAVVCQIDDDVLRDRVQQFFDERRRR
jgi:hypothetical protein